MIRTFSGVYCIDPDQTCPVISVLFLYQSSLGAFELIVIYIHTLENVNLHCVYMCQVIPQNVKQGLWDSIFTSPGPFCSCISAHCPLIFRINASAEVRLSVLPEGIQSAPVIEPAPKMSQRIEKVPLHILWERFQRHL